MPPVNSPYKGQWRGALMFSLIYAWINGWVNNGEAGDLRSHRAHYNVTVMPHTISSPGVNVDIYCINNLFRAEFILGNISIYWQCLSFRDTEMAHVVKILHRGRQWPIHHAESIRVSWCTGNARTGASEALVLSSSRGIFRFKHQSNQLFSWN